MKILWKITIKGEKAEAFESLKDAIAYGNSTGKSYDINSFVSPE